MLSGSEPGWNFRSVKRIEKKLGVGTGSDPEIMDSVKRLLESSCRDQIVLLASKLQACWMFEIWISMRSWQHFFVYYSIRDIHWLATIARCNSTGVCMNKHIINSVVCMPCAVLSNCSKTARPGFTWRVIAISLLFRPVPTQSGLSCLEME